MGRCSVPAGLAMSLGISGFVLFVITGLRALMPVITPRLTGHNARRWSGIIGVGVVILHG